MSNKNDHDIYIIPPNFIETGTFFGGMFRARNVIEAGILAFAIGTPVFLFLPFGLTARIIALCLTALPVALVALIGISGESLSQFLITFLKYLRNRRIVGSDGEQPGEKMVASNRSLQRRESPRRRSAGSLVMQISQLSLMKSADMRSVKSSAPRKMPRRNGLPRPVKRKRKQRSGPKKSGRLNAPPISRRRSLSASIRWQTICPLRRSPTALSTRKTTDLSRWLRWSPSTSCCGAHGNREILSTLSSHT